MSNETLPNTGAGIQTQTTHKNCFDYSMMQSFLDCRRMYNYRYNMGYVLAKEATAPNFGAGIHTALDSWYVDKNVEKAVGVFNANYKENLEIDDKRTARMGEWILRNYHEHYKDQALVLLQAETPFEIRLPAPNHNTVIGRIDKIIEWDGSIWVMDHKTTSSIGVTYPKKAEPNLQFDTYLWAAAQMGYKAQGVIMDSLLVAKGLLEAASRARLTPLLRIDSYRSKEKQAEFLEIIYGIQCDVFRCEKECRWTPNYGNCAQFGECPYRRVCIEEANLRDRILKGSEYKVEFWDPRRKNDLP